MSLRNGPGACAGAASVALEKTETHERGHKIAIELQHSLLPPSLPEITAHACYLPASDDQTVGGNTMRAAFANGFR